MTNRLLRQTTWPTCASPIPAINGSQFRVRFSLVHFVKTISMLPPLISTGPLAARHTTCSPVLGGCVCRRFGHQLADSTLAVSAFQCFAYHCRDLLFLGRSTGGDFSISRTLGRATHWLAQHHGVHPYIVQRLFGAGRLRPHQRTGCWPAVRTRTPLANGCPGPKCLCHECRHTCRAGCSRQLHRSAAQPCLSDQPNARRCHVCSRMVGCTVGGLWRFENCL